MNSKLIALQQTCSTINAKIDAHKNIEGFIPDADYVKEHEADTIKQCCELLAKFLQDNGMNEIEIVQVPTLVKRGDGESNHWYKTQVEGSFY